MSIWNHHNRVFMAYASIFTRYRHHSFPNRVIMASGSRFTRMFHRNLAQHLQYLLANSPAVVLLGPRQVGKTTLALDFADLQPSIYLDLEDDRDRAKLSQPASYLAEHENKLVILDEVHRVPELFQSLRGIIDKGRRKGKGTNRFLLLGSASMDLLRQSGESLAGRISYIELSPFHPLEIDPKSIDPLWIRGGFPRSFLATTEKLSLQWRRDFIRTYLERDIPQFAPRMASETLRRFWIMLAHNQAQF